MTPSTNPLPEPDGMPPWRAAGLPYFGYGFFLKRRFGHRVHKVSIDAGFTCPNVDGRVATGGCVFCDNRSFSPSRRVPRMSPLLGGGIRGQIDDGIRRLKLRYPCDHFLAYFQPATNTYAPVERLRTVYDEALCHPQIVGMAVGTRPDCVADDVMELLAQIAAKTFLSVEYGMQTMHDRSLVWMNRGHNHEALVDAVRRSRGLGFEICAHVILGLPGETLEDMRATAREVARLNFDAVKIHNLYAVKNTPLVDQLRSGQVRLMERDEYVAAAVDFIELLPATCVVERIHGDAPPDYLVGPSWCLDRPAVRQAIEAEFHRRGTWQGKLRNDE